MHGVHQIDCGSKKSHKDLCFYNWGKEGLAMEGFGQAPKGARASRDQAFAKGYYGRHFSQHSHGSKLLQGSQSFCSSWSFSNVSHHQCLTLHLRLGKDFYRTLTSSSESPTRDTLTLGCLCALTVVIKGI